MKIIAQNKKAHFDYTFSETLEAGVVLTGDEVKSIRAGHVSLAGSYATVKGDEIVLLNCAITPYSKAYQKLDEAFGTRTRKLLLKRREINKLIAAIAQKGVTVIPLKIYISEKGLVKLELGVGKHKKAAGQKQELKERDIKRQTQRELKNIRNS